MLSPILAQIPSPIPVNGQTVSLLSYVTNALDALIAPTSTTFLATVAPLVNKFGVFLIVLGSIVAIYHYLVGYHAWIMPIFKAVFAYMVAYNLIRYYNSPMPLVGVSFYQMFTAERDWMAATIDVHVLNLFLDRIRDIWGKMEKPHVYDLPATLIYMWVGLQMASLECCLFVITGFSFFAIGVGIIMGPWAILAYMFPATRHFFWSWVNYMIKYSLYKVVASAVVNIFATATLGFITQTLHGDYSIGHWWAVAISFTVICFMGVFACLKVGGLTTDFTSGGAHSGSISIPFINRFL